MKNDKMLVEYVARDGQPLKLTFDNVRKYLVQGRQEYVSEQELMFFMMQCKSLGLNPFKRDCYLIKYAQDGNAAIVTAKDHFISRAESMKDLEYWKAGIIVQDKIGDEVKRVGACPREDDELIGGWFEGKKSTRTQPTEIEVSLPTYIKKTRHGELTQFWKEEKQAMMIRKVALSQGLREMYPDEFKGLYDEAEIVREPVSDEIIDVEPDRDLDKELMKPTTHDDIVEETAKQLTKGAPPREESDPTPSVECEVCNYEYFREATERTKTGHRCDNCSLFWLVRAKWTDLLPSFLKAYPEWNHAVQKAFRKKFRNMEKTQFKDEYLEQYPVEPEQKPEKKKEPEKVGEEINQAFWGGFVSQLNQVREKLSELHEGDDYLYWETVQAAGYDFDKWRKAPDGKDKAQALIAELWELTKK